MLGSPNAVRNLWHGKQHHKEGPSCALTSPMFCVCHSRHFCPSPPVGLCRSWSWPCTLPCLAFPHQRWRVPGPVPRSTSARKIVTSGLAVQVAIPSRSKSSRSVAPMSFQIRKRVFKRPLSLPFVGCNESLRTTISSFSRAHFHSAMERNGRRPVILLESSSGRQTIGGSSSCPICRSPVSRDFRSSPTVTDKTTSADSVCKFLVRLRRNTMSSQSPSLPHRNPDFSTSSLAASAEVHLAFVILITTSCIPKPSTRCQEAKPPLVLAACKHGRIMLWIQTLPSRNRSCPSSTV